MVGTNPTVLPDSRMASNAREHPSTVSSTDGRGSMVGGSAVAGTAVFGTMVGGTRVSTGLMPPALPPLPLR